MGLVVPLLRLFFVFINIYESFKVLKLPPPSPRNGGQPSVRAMTQRKRNMKGVMTIWMVWCCCTAYEKTLDSVIGIFIPFYDELKSLIVLFFIVTRARGAEPIYLHVIRPMIKPYTTTLDALLDALSSVGEFILILFAWPGHAVLSWYRHWASSGSDVDDDLQSVSSSEMLVQDARPIPVLNCSHQTRYRSRSRTVSDDASTVADINTRLQPSDPNPEPVDALAGQQIWYPPPPAYEQEQSGMDGLPQFSVAPRFDIPQISVQVRTASDPHAISSLSPDPIDEWRKYPDFPSAYPPTPIAPPKSFRIVAPVPKRPSDIINFVDISEEEESSDSQTADSRAKKREMGGSVTEKGGVQQDFRRSLLEPRESMNPDSDRHLSDDDDSMGGVQIVIEGDERRPSEEVLSDEDGELDTTMNTTLRTPRALRRGKNEEEADMDVPDHEQDGFDFNTPMQMQGGLLKPRPQLMISVPSTSSWQSRSTALSTTDGGSSLRTQTGSESESSKPASDTSSIAGHKRPLPRSRDSQATVRVRVRAPSMSRCSSSGDAKPFPTRVRARMQVRRSAKTDSENYEEDEINLTSDASSITKKRKIVGPTDTVPRPQKRASAQFLASLPARRKVPSKGAVPPAVRRSTRTTTSKDPLHTYGGAGGAGANSMAAAQR